MSDGPYEASCCIVHGPRGTRKIVCVGWADADECARQLNAVHAAGAASRDDECGELVASVQAYADTLRVALEFYANAANYENRQAIEHGIARPEPSEVYEDGGRIARAALSPPAAKESPQ